jgi:hypothetical protein
VKALERETRELTLKRTESPKSIPSSGAESLFVTELSLWVLLLVYHIHASNKINRGTTTAPATVPPLDPPFDPLALDSLVGKAVG